MLAAERVKPFQATGQPVMDDVARLGPPGDPPRP